VLLPTEPGIGPHRNHEQIKRPLLKDRRLGEHFELGDVLVGGLNSIFDNRRQIAEE